MMSVLIFLGGNSISRLHLLMPLYFMLYFQRFMGEILLHLMNTRDVESNCHYITS